MTGKEVKGKWQEVRTIRASEVGPGGKINLMAIGQFLQEAAGNHAAQKKLGFHGMMAINRFWVLNRMKIEMYSWPKWNDETHVHTWVKDFRGPFSHREFHLLDSNNQKLGAASTLWVALDSNSRRPVRMDTELSAFIHFPDDAALPSPPEKIAPIEAGVWVSHYSALHSDLDIIGHVNNTVYLRWITDSFSDEFRKENSLSSIEINYLGETHLHDEVSIYSQNETPNIRTYSLKINEREVCRARIHSTPNHK